MSKGNISKKQEEILEYIKSQILQEQKDRSTVIMQSTVRRILSDGL